MLHYLKIRNFALLDAVELEFASGFSAVTGETGAGKSVLLGALGLLSGGRTDKTMIRQGAEELEVAAALWFEDSGAIDRELEALGLPACEEGRLLLQRVVSRSKPARVQINGSMATLAQMAALGEAWIDFHGPGEPQKLFQEKRQLEMLDGFARNAGALIEYRRGFEEWRELLAGIEAIESGERMDEDEIDFVRKQIARIDAVEVGEASIEALERDYARMSSAQELAALAAGCAEGITGDGGLSEQMSALVARFEEIAELDPESGPLAERARSLQIDLQDLGEEVGRSAGDFDFDPEAVEAVTERMNLWQELRRKYGGSVESVLARREELARKIAVQGDLEGELERRRWEASRLESELSGQAERLTEARRRASAALGEKAAALLKALGFKKARLAIEIESEPALTGHGDSRCRFLFAPNAGQDLMPLNKIASSGETARVMLALKTVLAEADATPLLVFDEVDANVGGEVGRAVGTELARLAGRHQVLCVTHLPQVAALARNHYVVRKLQDEDRTTVAIVPIHDERETRLEELARMLGDRGSASARAHAEELLG